MTLSKPLDKKVVLSTGQEKRMAPPPRCPNAHYCAYLNIRGLLDQQGRSRRGSTAVCLCALRRAFPKYQLPRAAAAKIAGVKLPTKDRDGQPIIFDSYDMSPVLFGTGKSARQTWFYFTEDELLPGAIRYHQFK